MQKKDKTAVIFKGDNFHGILIYKTIVLDSYFTDFFPKSRNQRFPLMACCPAEPDLCDRTKILKMENCPII